MNDKQKKDMKYLLENNKNPLVFKKFLNWSILKWSLDDWKQKFQNKKLIFRKNSPTYSNVIQIYLIFK